MKPDCRNFRARLAEVLRGPLLANQEPALGGLSWHRHVIDCSACRELLDEEEALDELLRSLPKPHLPRALAERVLSRLDGPRRGLDLDRLLDLETTQPVPVNLARDVLARVHAEQSLDRLLDRVPAPSMPAGLDRRILARLELARRGEAVRPRTEPTSPLRAVAAERKQAAASFQFPLRIAAGFALASLAGWGAWRLTRNGFEPSPTPAPTIAEVTGPGNSTKQAQPTPGVLGLDPAAIAQPDEQLLASLEMFEAWDLLASADAVDASLVTLDSIDEYLLDFGTPSSSAENTPAAEIPAGDSDTKNTKKNG